MKPAFAAIHRSALMLCMQNNTGERLINVAKRSSVSTG